MNRSSKVLWVRKSDSFYHFYTSKPKKKKCSYPYTGYYWEPDTLESLCIRRANEEFPTLKNLSLKGGKIGKVRITFSVAE